MTFTEVWARQHQARMNKPFEEAPPVTATTEEGARFAWEVANPPAISPAHRATTGGESANDFSRVIDEEETAPTQGSEAELQARIVEALEGMGCTVMIVGKSRGRVKCKECGAYGRATGWQGNTPGVPDLICGHPTWGDSLLGLEVKLLSGLRLDGQPKAGNVRPEQAALVASGFVYIVRTVGQAVAIVGRKLEGRR